MTQDEMFDDIRTQMRAGKSAMAAMHDTLTKAGSECLPFYGADKMLYVQCHSMPPESIRTIDFLASSNQLTWRIQVVAGVAYMRIYK